MPKARCWVIHLRSLLWAVVFTPFSLPTVVDAQGETTSAIVGSVSDPSGAAVAGAKVVVISTDNGMQRYTLTDLAGRFNVPQLKPGPYAVRVEVDRFEVQENQSVFA